EAVLPGSCDSNVTSLDIEQRQLWYNPAWLVPSAVRLTQWLSKSSWGREAKWQCRLFLNVPMNSVFIIESE
ncbi:hypothetical protein HispidOSU_011588, partial [Sigmodon hispidus]